MNKQQQAVQGCGQLKRTRTKLCLECLTLQRLDGFVKQGKAKNAPRGSICRGCQRLERLQMRRPITVKHSEAP